MRFRGEKSLMLNDCRVAVRDAEISLHRFLESPEKKNEIDKIIPAFFNRLSSLFFAMALRKEFDNLDGRNFQKIG